MTRSGSVWRNLKLGLAMLMTGALLAACGGGGDDPPPTPTAACDAGYQTILKSVPGAAAAVAPASVSGKKTTAAVPAGTLRIHYKRTDNDYTGWQLYTYSPEVMGGWPGADSTGTDDYGVFWDVPVGTAPSVNFIIHKGNDTREPSNWSGKTGSDEQQFWQMSAGNEIWKRSGDAVNYTQDPSTIVVDIEKVRVHYKRFDGQYNKFGLHLWKGLNDDGSVIADGSGIDNLALAEAGVAMPGWGDAVGFDQLPGYKMDDFGVVFELPVVNPKTSDRTSFTFVLHGDGGAGGDANYKDGWGSDVKPEYLAMTIDAATKTADIWMVQETANVSYSKPELRSVSTTDMRAYALNKQLFKWPRVDTSGSFKLYYSANGQLSATLDGEVTGADGSLDLEVFSSPVPADAAERFKFVAPGVVLNVKEADLTADNGLMYKRLLAGQTLLVQQNAEGKVQNATNVQWPGALDDMYAAAAHETAFGAHVADGKTSFKLWAPTARSVSVCVYDTATGGFTKQINLKRSYATGIWSGVEEADLKGKYYKFAVTVFVRGVGLVRNLVTDPYSVSLTTDSKRSYIADLSDASLKPEGWDDYTGKPLADQTDMSIYELHVRDFSIGDSTVPAAHRGTYAAFTHANSNGMKHLKALADAGLTDVHLLPVFDIATIPEAGCETPAVPNAGAASAAQREALIEAGLDEDCFNWGYDPYHYTAPEGSYATDAADGAVRIKEFRSMVKAMHDAGLRVGMDVVYNHTNSSGQGEKSVLDRIVPGYYHRLDDRGNVLRDTCCDDTAAENLMMAKLMSDSVMTWATQYHIDSFRFDLMAFHPRAVLEEMKNDLKEVTGRDIHFLGEGWNYGAVENGRRFVQASQLSLNGSGIATFSDRARDAINGNFFGQGDANFINMQGYISGMFYDANKSSTQTKTDLLKYADMVRVGLAGSIRSYSFKFYDDQVRQLEKYGYGAGNFQPITDGDGPKAPAGYVTQPHEVVNYVENHDNQTLYDLLAYKLPLATTSADRARVQMLGAALNAFSQGIAYYHAGVDTLRSKSLTGNSYNAGDWFNRLDWTYADNGFAAGLPLEGRAADSVMKPILENATAKPAAADIAWARDVFRDILKIRADTTLLRLRTADDIKSRLTFYNTGSTQNGALIVGHLNGAGYAGAKYNDLIYLVNVDNTATSITIPEQAAKAYALHAAQAGGKDAIAKTATYNADGTFTIPARTAVVFVAN